MFPRYPDSDRIGLAWKHFHVLSDERRPRGNILEKKKLAQSRKIVGTVAIRRMLVLTFVFSTTSAKPEECRYGSSKKNADAYVDTTEMLVFATILVHF